MTGLTDRRVSWLIPARDAERWLAEAVGSALEACSAADEVVVVDDGSSHDPRALLPTDPRLRLLRQPPLGIAAALETGRAACRGRYIARLDADDRSLPGRIPAQLRAFAANPLLAAVGGEGQAHPDGSLGPGMALQLAWLNGLHTPDELRRNLLVESPLLHPAVLLRADLLAAVGGYRDFDGPEDYDLWLRLAAAGHHLANVAQPVVALRDRADRLTRTDPRYSREAFRACKMAWFRAVLRPAARRVAVWGAGRSGRPWVRFLIGEGLAVVAVLDLKPGGSRQGVPVLPVSALAGLEVDLLLVAVGARGARDEIRHAIEAGRPGWVEGRDWWALT